MDEDDHQLINTIYHHFSIHLILEFAVVFGLCFCWAIIGFLVAIDSIYYWKIIIIEMEEISLQLERHSHSPQRANYQQKKGFFRNILKSESKRFSSLVISNAISIEDNKIYFKIFMLSLEKPPSERTEEDDLATCKVLIEENIFPEFHNDLNVLKIFAKNLAIRHLQPGQHLLTPNTKDENLYKVIKGETGFRRARDGSWAVKGKGELIESFQEFKLIKDFEVQCREEAYLLAINYRSYEEAMHLYLENKIILKMLAKTSLFQSFERKQLAFLLHRSNEKVLSCKESLFEEGDADNDLLYFLVQGEVVISKQDHHRRRQVVCYLADGSLFGEEYLLLDKKRRDYSAAVHSSQARFIQISRAGISEMLANYEVGREQFFGNVRYRDYLVQKNSHYAWKMSEVEQVKLTCQSSLPLKKMAEPRLMQMNSILRDAQNYAIRLENKEKILEKRNLYMKDRKLITVETPLFGRDDFPGYKQYMRRYQLYELRAKENSCKLPHLG